MGKNEIYHENQLVELYKLVYTPLKTETHIWEIFFAKNSNRTSLMEIICIGI